MNKPSKGILNREEIFHYYKTGDIVINPFNENQLNPSSYDVSLGKHCYRERKEYPWRYAFLLGFITIIFASWTIETTFLCCFIILFIWIPRLCDDFILNPYSEKSVKDCWIADEAQKASHVLNSDDMVGIDPDDKVILIRPQETILCHTKEVIGSKCNYNPQLLCKSSWGRSFISVCKCSSWGNVGFVDKWTLEITNNSTSHTVPLVVGRPIGQVIFHSINTPEHVYDGLYNSSSWKPDDMLPKIYKRYS